MRPVPGGILLSLVLGLALALGCSRSTTRPPAPATPTAPALDASGPTAQDDSMDTAPAAVAPAAPEPAPTPKPPGTKKVVVLDPGHGGDEVGAAAFGVVEKASNLDMALRVEKLLVAAGVDVVLTRRTDARAAEPVAGYTAARTDLQARIDLANAVGADVFVSLHSNGSSDLGQKGVEVWYDSARPFADQNLLLAKLLLGHVLSELDAYGYAAQDRGLYDGSCFRLREGRCFTLFVLGGPRQTTREQVTRLGGDPEALGFNGAPAIYSRATNMPGALVENLIITNAADAAVLKQDAARDAIARGVADAILEFLGLPGSS